MSLWFLTISNPTSFTLFSTYYSLILPWCFVFLFFLVIINNMFLIRINTSSNHSHQKILIYHLIDFCFIFLFFKRQCSWRHVIKVKYCITFKTRSCVQTWKYTFKISVWRMVKIFWKFRHIKRLIYNLYFYINVYLLSI